MDEAAAKKRKHNEAADGEGEVPDSQGAKVEAPKEEKAPHPKKRGRGRPARASQASKLSTEINVAGEAPHPSSVDIDAPMQDMAIVASTTHAFTSSSIDTPEDGKVEVVEPHDDSSKRDGIPTPQSTLLDKNWLDLEAANKKTTEEGLIAKSCQHVLKPGEDPAEEAKTQIDTTGPAASEPAAATVNLSLDASLVEVQKAPAATVPIITTKLQTLITDLGNTSLSRDEFNILEDLLVDVKRKLFDAEKRGRQGME